jgi:hypothetical protein
MYQEDEPFTSFVVGHIASKEVDFDVEENMRAIKDIENLMIRYGLIRIDVGINPYTFPKDLINL